MSEVIKDTVEKVITEENVNVKREIVKYAIDKIANIGYITLLYTREDNNNFVRNKYFRIKPIDIASNHVINDITRYEDNKQALWDEIARIEALPNTIPDEESEIETPNLEKMWHIIGKWEMKG